ncbi:hypothetical protein B566_EDAN009056 [Ephemera danica]|nr:hypothetical protein B566_EDAN009056 [Ephemera danica]
MSAKKILFVCLVAILHGQVQRTRGHESRIIGGDIVSSNTKYPSQCSLRYLGDHACGCIVLTENHILTAASCTSALLGNRLSAHVGTTHVTTGGQNYELGDVTNHPDYVNNDPATPDIAIVTQDEVTPPGSAAVIIGWGYTANLEPISPSLMEANLTVRDLAECATIYAGEVTITDTKVCADVPQGGVGYCNRVCLDAGDVGDPGPERGDARVDSRETLQCGALGRGPRDDAMQDVGHQ